MLCAGVHSHEALLLGHTLTAPKSLSMGLWRYKRKSTAVIISDLSALIMHRGTACGPAVAEGGVAEGGQEVSSGLR